VARPDKSNHRPTLRAELKSLDAQVHTIGLSWTYSMCVALFFSTKTWLAILVERIWSELDKRLAIDEPWTLIHGELIEVEMVDIRSPVVAPMRHGRVFLAGKRARPVREGAVGKGPEPRHLAGGLLHGTASSASGLEKRTASNPDTAPQADSTTHLVRASGEG
jgi:hypothetical protein